MAQSAEALGGFQRPDMETIDVCGEKLQLINLAFEGTAQVVKGIRNDTENEESILVLFPT